MEKLYRLDITMNEDNHSRLENLARKMGHRNEGHVINLGIKLLERAYEAVDKGREVGEFEEEDDKVNFLGWLLPVIVNLKEGDARIGTDLTCEKCHTNFALKANDIIRRQQQEHEGFSFVDCPHCGWENSF